jgi:hypothetical protein
MVSPYIYLLYLRLVNFYVIAVLDGYILWFNFC